MKFHLLSLLILELLKNHGLLEEEIDGLIVVLSEEFAKVFLVIGWVLGKDMFNLEVEWMSGEDSL